MEADEQHLKNQQEFRRLLEEHGLTQAQAAQLITEETKRNVTPRSVRRWLAQPDARSLVICADWSVEALKKAINNKHLSKDKKT